jgi:outer membrane protein assembly factor BamB
MIKFCLMLILIFPLLPASGQESPFLSNFTATEINGNVYLHWTINTGNTCNGISIQRSTDGILFTEIYNIAGVCGNIFSPQTYDHTDADPIANKISYYRLDLGNVGFSETVSIEIIDIAANGYQVRPNPFRNSAVIYFDNDSRHNQLFNVYNANGQLVYSIETNSDQISIPEGTLQTGLHIFKLTSEETKRSVLGKLLVSE